MKTTRMIMMPALRAAASLALAVLLFAAPASAQAPDSEDPFSQAQPAPPAPPPGAPVARPASGPAAPPATLLPMAPAVQAPPPGSAVPPPAPRPPRPPTPYPPLQPTQLDEARRAQLFEPEGPIVSWDPLRFAVAFEGRVTRPLDDGAKRLASERWPAGAGVSVQADVFRPSAELAIRLDLGWTRTKSSSYQPDSSLSEQLKTDLFQLGAQARYHVLRWLAPYVRLSAGLGRDKLNVGVMSDQQWFGQAAAGAGLFLRSAGLRLWQGRFSPLLGLVGSLEGGYTLAMGSDFSLQASLPSASEHPIPTSEVALGHVGRSAPYLRASLGLAF